ncbi:bifunctional glutamate N-acetyltransferase/amino-acid acetyltransferase ArgJ [Thermocaproicibacter melissae]|jgi:glutamate N-acetyltransferase / amino-acid N-acetyltransferase|uniref:bifunctional glutamate N-acetyltransferase/amino-acid acetyltransferase ArgJ n=1 Tax=Thermocaproicibacter melissae TaxID=2966552 RepID=UPI0024B1CF33|nr:bifunctional glutamate N-acetyltransferase/amino-acid acetyltransferase ArgJ [Thermocaproicibacter melissae]WBY63828.1 bifunctional glutamate N-acetyltransferase/amino-acid acetyltransferase ArgJ [Thermocaproicibacter melissae]
MAEYPYISGGVCAAKGFKAGGVHCGIRKNVRKPDLAMIVSTVPCAAAAVYTKNLVKGAPILVTKENLADGTAQAVICNSGNANTCNADGVQKAMKMCWLAADALGVRPKDVIVASTGVIGQVLPIEPIAAAIPGLAASLTTHGSEDAARAIMTTDTVIKNFAVSCTLGGKEVRIGGIAKGSGMIHPNMGTMLCFLTTDAAISAKALDAALRSAVDVSFNMVSIDGDTSTNDTCAILANGLAENPKINEPEGEDYKTFTEALTQLCVKIARTIAKDGEGASRLLVCEVTGAKDEENAKKAAKGIICSSLFKAAMFGADANWGRVLCALGYCGAETDVTKVGVSFSSKAGSVKVCENGAGIPFSEEEAKKILSEDEITVHVSLGDGNASATAFGCDLTYDYVKINGDYRT